MGAAIKEQIMPKAETATAKQRAVLVEVVLEKIEVE